MAKYQKVEDQNEIDRITYTFKILDISYFSTPNSHADNFVKVLENEISHLFQNIFFFKYHFTILLICEKAQKFESNDIPLEDCLQK